MSENIWIFPKSGRVQNVGADGEGSDQYSSYPIVNLAREVIQNSLDARKDNKTAVVEFHMFTTTPNEFPDSDHFAEYVAALQRQYYKQPDTSKDKVFVKQLFSALTTKKVCWLRISDFNTTGLWGTSDYKNQDTPWFAFIKGAGKSHKEGLAGGARGQGKMAIYTNSLLNTMLVSTFAHNPLNDNDERASMGIAKLASLTLTDECPENPDWTVGIGFLVDNNEDSINYLKNSNDMLNIDPEFNREVMGYGTDIYLPCFGYYENWDETLINEAIYSFLPAIMNNELKVIVSNDSTTQKSEISSYTIQQFLYGKGSAKKTNKALVNAYNSTTKKVINFDKEGFEMTLILHQDQLDGLNKVVEYRFPTKMKIQEESIPSNVGYTGILYVTGAELCARLRNIEDATHSRWTIGRWKKSGYTRDKIEEALRIVENFITDECAKFGANYTGNEIYYDIEGWNSEEDTSDMSLDEHSEIGLPTDEIVFDKKADPATNPKAHRPRKRKGNVVDDKGNAETDIEDIGEPGTGEYDMTHPEGHNKGKGGEIHGGDAEDKYDPNSGEKIVIARRRIQALEARIPAIEPSEGLFDLIFNPTKTGTDVYIELLKSGIDGETEETIINSALLDGKPLEIINNKIHLDKIEKNQQYRIHLNLAETTNFIWEVNIDAED